MTSTATITESKTKVQIKQPVMWRVVFLNDNFTPFEFVIEVLVQLFNKSVVDANNIAMTIHETGRGTVSVYPEEIAKQKASDVCRIAKQHDYPLKAISEPA